MKQLRFRVGDIVEYKPEHKKPEDSNYGSELPLNGQFRVGRFHDNGLDFRIDPHPRAREYGTLFYAPRFFQLAKPRIQIALEKIDL